MGSAHDTSTNKQIGTHIVRVESAEALCVAFHGVMTTDDAKIMKTMMYEHERIHGPYSYIANVSAMTGIDSGARHEFIHVDRPYPFKHCFVVGASFGIRTLIEGLYRARRLLRPGSFHYSMEMVAKETEALERAKKYKQMEKTWLILFKRYEKLAISYVTWWRQRAHGICRARACRRQNREMRGVGD